MVYLRLASDTPLRRSFDSLPPAEGAPAGGWQPGLRLAVPFGRGEAVGVLLEAVGTTEVPATKLRQVLATLDTEPVLDPVTLGLLRWAADYYHHPIGEVFAAALPVLLRQGRAAQADRRVWSLTDAGSKALEGNAVPSARLGKRQREALELLRTHSAGLTLAHYAALTPPLRTALRDAVERGWTQLTEAVAAAPGPSVGPAVLRRRPHSPLSPPQAPGSTPSCWRASPAAARPKCTCACWKTC